MAGIKCQPINMAAPLSADFNITIPVGLSHSVLGCNFNFQESQTSFTYCRIPVTAAELGLRSVFTLVILPRLKNIKISFGVNHDFLQTYGTGVLTCNICCKMQLRYIHTEKSTNVV